MTPGNGRRDFATAHMKKIEKGEGVYTTALETLGVKEGSNA